MFTKTLVFFGLLAVCSCRSAFNEFTNVTKLITQHGYPVEYHEIVTEDGYYLGITRIPHGRQSRYQSNPVSSESQSSQSESSQESSESREKSQQWNRGQDGYSRPAVILMPGLLSGPEDFVIGGPTESLAMYLADNQYDVYLASPRGSWYGRKHTTLDPERDPAFWRFCWHEMGTKDLPAIVDKVLQISNKQKVYYIGHMQGNTMFYVLNSMLPEYNNKFHGAIALGPVAFLGNAKSHMLRYISKNRQSQGWISRYLGVNEFKPTTELITEGGQKHCQSYGMNNMICENVFFLFNGYNSKNLNTTTIERAVRQHLPSTSSTRQIIHYTQLMESGRFVKYNADSAVMKRSTDEYDLTQIKTPMAMMYTTNDDISDVKDVQTLISKLPNVVEEVKFEKLTNNIDLLYAEHVSSYVYPKIMTAMKSFAQRRQ